MENNKKRRRKSINNINVYNLHISCRIQEKVALTRIMEYLIAMAIIVPGTMNYMFLDYQMPVEPTMTMILRQILCVAHAKVFI